MSSLTPRVDKLERNYIINGNFDFWQRGTSSGALVSGNYLADRFQVNFSNAATRTVSRSALIPNTKSLYSLQYLVGTADASVAASDYENIHYHLEGNDFKNLAGKAITLSFWVRSSITGTYCCAFRNNAVDRSYVSTYIINVANTWEKKTISLTHDTVGTWLYDNNTGLNVSFALMCGTTYQIPTLNSWQAGNYIGHSSAVNFMGTAGAQINISQVAIYEGILSDPEFNTAGKNYAEELLFCQRYFEKCYNLDHAVGSNRTGDAAGTGGLRWITSVSGFSIPILIQHKRAYPIITLYDWTGNINRIRTNSLGDNQTSYAVEWIGDRQFHVHCTATDVGCYFYWTVDAEIY